MNEVTADSSEASTERIIAVRSRRALGADAAWVELGVACPVRGTDVALEECVRCGRCEGLRIDADSGGASVRCHLPGDLPPPMGVSGTALPSFQAALADRTPVSEIMTTHVICVRPDLGMSRLGAVFLETGISGAPVVDDFGKPLGVVSKTDLVRWLCGSGSPDRSGSTVADIMLPIAFCLPVNEFIAKAAALMAFERFHRVPVVGSLGQVVGIVSSLDVLAWLARGHGYVIGERSAIESSG